MDSSFHEQEEGEYVDLADTASNRLHDFASARAQDSPEQQMGANLASLRRLGKLSRTTLATRSGISIASLKAYEDGRTRIPPHDLLKLCDALHVTLPELFPRDRR